MHSPLPSSYTRSQMASYYHLTTMQINVADAASSQPQRTSPTLLLSRELCQDSTVN